MSGHALADDLADRHAGIEAGVGILEDHLQILAELADLVILEAGKVDAVVAEAFQTLEFFVAGIGLAHLLDHGALFVHLLAQSIKLGIDAVHLGLELGSLSLGLFGLLAVVDGKLRVGQIQLGIGQTLGSIVHLGGYIVNGHESIAYGLDVLSDQEAADQVGHIQETVVGFLAGMLQIVELVILGLAVGHGVVFLLQSVALGFQRLKLAAALAKGLDGLAHILGSQIIQRAAVVHGTAVGLAVQLQKRTAQRGLAAAGLAYQTQRLAFINIQRDAVVGFYVQALLFQREVLFEVADAKQRLALTC